MSDWLEDLQAKQGQRRESEERAAKRSLARQEELREYVDKVVAAAPPLTTEQRAMLASILGKETK